MKWDSLSVTNVLLLIIAVLMLIMVAQQPRNYQAPRTTTPNLTEMGSVPPTSQMPNPHANVDMPQAGSDDNFNFQNMIFAALICPSDATITLADFACEGAEASSRRDYVKKIYEQGLAPRALFDEIIETYGEEALTDEAREIRRTNRAGK